MKIGFDWHGVLDSMEVMRKLAEHHWKHNDHVYIITGLSRKDLDEELKATGFHYFDCVFSIVDHIIEIGEEVTWDDEGMPWADKTLWNNAKRDYCKKNQIAIMYDDSLIYKDTFNDIDTVYCHVINPDRKIYKVREE